MKLSTSFFCILRGISIGPCSILFIYVLQKLCMKLLFFKYLYGKQVFAVCVELIVSLREGWCWITSHLGRINCQFERGVVLDYQSFGSN